MKKKWEKLENKVAKEFGGKKNKASGSLWNAPSDVKTSKYLIECKQTSKKSFSITHDLWEKLSDEALFSKKLPLLVIQLNDLELLVFDKNDALALLNGKNPFSGTTGANLPLANEK